MSEQINPMLGNDEKKSGRVKYIIGLIIFLTAGYLAKDIFSEREEKEVYNPLMNEEIDYAWTGNGFYEILTEQSLQGRSIDEGVVGTSIGYIMGIWESLNKIYWEFPEGMEPTQAVAIVKNYLKRNPEGRDEYIFPLIIDALSENLSKPEVPMMILNPEWQKKESKD